MKRTKLFFLFAALFTTCFTALAADWDKPVPASSEPVSKQTYYLYNLATEKFMSANGMTVTLEDQGSPIVSEAFKNRRGFSMESLSGYVDRLLSLHMATGFGRQRRRR